MKKWMLFATCVVGFNALFANGESVTEKLEMSSETTVCSCVVGDACAINNGEEEMAKLDAEHYRNNSDYQFGVAGDAMAWHTFSGTEDILDMGCGDGRISHKMAIESSGGSVLGVDLSPEMILLARESFPRSENANLKFEVGNAETYFVDKQFDLITSFSCVHWVRDQKKALTQMVDMLKPGGRLLALTYPAGVPFSEVSKELILSEKWSQYSADSACNTNLDAKGYTSILSGLGVKIIRSEVSEEIATYANRQAYIDYVRGWLPCLISLPDDQVDPFLNDLADRACEQFSKLEEEELNIPYQLMVFYIEKN